MFRVHPTTVTRWANEGKLPFVVTNRSYRRYRSSEVTQMLAADEQPAQLPTPASPETPTA